MTDQLANTKAFLVAAFDVVQAKKRWEAYSSNAIASMLDREITSLDAAIRSDDPAFVFDGTPSVAAGNAAVRAYASALFAATTPVAYYASNGGLGPDQAAIFGDGGTLPYGNPGFVGDLVTAVQLDAPGWTP